MSGVDGGLAEGVGFEPTVALRLRLISSQVPLTTQPPFQIQYVPNGGDNARIKARGKVIRRTLPDTRTHTSQGLIFLPDDAGKALTSRDTGRLMEGDHSLLNAVEVAAQQRRRPGRSGPRWVFTWKSVPGS